MKPVHLFAVSEKEHPLIFRHKKDPDQQAQLQETSIVIVQHDPQSLSQQTFGLLYLVSLSNISTLNNYYFNHIYNQYQTNIYKRTILFLSPVTKRKLHLAGT